MVSSESASFLHPKPFQRVRKEKTNAQCHFRDDEDGLLEFHVMDQDDEENENCE